MVITNVSRYLDTVRNRVEVLVDPFSRHLELLKGLNELTGATFSAINLCDGYGRMLGGVVWPLTPERQKLIENLSPRLADIVGMEDVQSYFMDGGLGCVKVMPQPLYRSSALYQEVYRHFKMEYAAWYFYPRLDNGDTVIVGIASEDVDFDAKTLRRFDRFCKAFEGMIVRITHNGDRLPVVTPRGEDHQVMLSPTLKPQQALWGYLRSVLLLFYGSDGYDEGILPESLIEEIKDLRGRRSEGMMPLLSRDLLSWHRMSRGRKLNLVLQATGKGGYQLQCHEDNKAILRLQKIREACLQLERDGSSIYSICQALLDGINDEKEILVRANLAALRPASARRIISKAKAMLKLS
ncbi:hypothetical protein IEN85_09865 [Pelagicoccus sp. NFK12]|uniref:Uncharacterized protein n=1 Tax=Pelagicoccus enzymogenes TaxID=2773457 RepID=A0A927F7C6_9BACT|nr:hypothetical protein [Pelagicoccus enzymogenes]MBD5779798.1 hypothetical protein [Pelagicoccus enzymogenes]